MRGASIPTGRDVLLRAGGNAYFVGDAAGLIHATLGGGIGYAAESARLLAAALTGGKDYEKAMRPTVTEVAMIAANAEKRQFLTNFRLMKKGQVYS